MESGSPTASKGSNGWTLFQNNRLLQLFAIGYAAVWIGAAITPHDRFDWFLENILVVIVLVVVVASYRALQLSNLSYLLIALFLSIHTVGSHYTYSLTPAGFWLQSALDLDRNHYDRVVHFLFGLMIFLPLSEILIRRTGIRGRWNFALTFASILALGNFYELLEWGAAEVISPDAAMAFLGTQGDIFDAQKDTTLAAAGAVLSWIAIALLPDRTRAQWPSQRSCKGPLEEEKKEK